VSTARHPGCWVMVFGPSGAGKDSVIAWARATLVAQPRIVFARRLVTRAAHSSTEHDEISSAALRTLREHGGLAWHWEAHGCGYGIPATYADDVAAGSVVVVNGSRAHLLTLGGRPDLRRVLVSAPSEMLRTRLERRGRDDTAALAERVIRNAAFPRLSADRVIDNVEDIATAGGALRRYLLELASQ
jgi:ribose 1,5-bisphosphokinase